MRDETRVYGGGRVSTVEDLLRGFADTHMHAGPGLIPRRLDAVEAARQARDAGQRAIVLKDHHQPTAAVARLVERYHAGGEGFAVLGSIVLNEHAGGLRPRRDAPLAGGAAGARRDARGAGPDDAP